jgi:PAS domain S-box-containing protein
MNFDPGILLIAAGCYLLPMFAVALATEKGLVPRRVLNHPAIYVLSLTIIVNTWAFFTAYISAAQSGYGYNTYYIGFAAAFLLAPILLKPVLQITRTYHLGSLPDLFAFRFRSQWAGILSSLITLACIFPLLALQIYAVAASTEFLAPDADPLLVALVYCIIIAAFTLRFGTRDVAGRQRNDSIAATLAFEAVFKLVVLLLAGAFAVWGVFGSLGELDAWLLSQPPRVTRLNIAFLQNSSNQLLLLYFTAVIAMPHMFHVIFQQNRDARHLEVASWSVPMYLLFASLPVLPIFWASSYLGSGVQVQFSMFFIGLLTEHPLLVLVFYTAGIAASCGMVVILAISVSSLCLNHLVLPLHKPPSGANLYRWLLWGRRLLVVAIIAGGYLCYLPNANGRYILDTGFISFITCVQFLPGILTMLYWPAANSKGFISGLVAGVVTWVVLGLVPLWFESAPFSISYIIPGFVNWNFVASASMMANLCTLVLVSLFTHTSKNERLAARMCSMDSLAQPDHGRLLVKNPGDFIAALSAPLGIETARNEVMQALRDLGLDEHETRPYHLQRLRVQTEANLSALLGPAIARQIMERFLPVSSTPGEASGSGLSFMERKLEHWPVNLSGIALDLDLLRRHHRQVLQNLPLAVCAVDSDGFISMWNLAMEKLTGVAEDKITGMPPDTLPEPWSSLLSDFIRDRDTTHVNRRSLIADGRQYSLSLHKAAFAETQEPQAQSAQGGQIVIIEDQTETTLLEAELAHAERLSSIGRLAAGVAHEIGNPVTGIACLAQNLRDETSDNETRELAEQIVQQTRRISSIMHSLVTFSHSGQQADQPVKSDVINLKDLADEAIRLISLQQDSREVRFLNACTDNCRVLGDHQRMLQVLINLMSNARDASEDGQAVWIHSRREGDQAQLEVRDLGCGIPPHIRDRIFEPFFTTKDPGKGTGLGLSLVYRIVKDLGGNIQLLSDPATLGEKGTRVIVTFPCYDASSTPTEAL